MGGGVVCHPFSIQPTILLLPDAGEGFLLPDIGWDISNSEVPLHEFFPCSKIVHEPRQPPPGRLCAQACPHLRLCPSPALDKDGTIDEAWVADSR